MLSSLQEGLSIALLEAMGSGLPCVVAHEQRVHDVIVHEENGLLVPTNDAEALERALERMIQDELLRAVLSRKAKEIIETEHSFEHMIAGYEQIYHKLAPRSS